MFLCENTMIKYTISYEEYVARKERSLRLEETYERKICTLRKERIFQQGMASACKQEVHKVHSLEPDTNPVAFKKENLEVITQVQSSEKGEDFFLSGSNQKRY